MRDNIAHKAACWPEGLGQSCAMADWVLQTVRTNEQMMQAMAGSGKHESHIEPAPAPAE